MRKTKFDAYFEICQKLIAELSGLGSKELQPLIDGFSNSIDQIDAWEIDARFPAPKSEIAKGLEQGVNELPLFFEELESGLRSKAFHVYYSAVNSVIPDYQEKIKNKIQRIIKRGKINSESEFYLLRNRLDQIESSGTNEESLVSDLLGQYETKA